jgi:GxxExxY protein
MIGLRPICMLSQRRKDAKGSKNPAAPGGSVTHSPIADRRGALSLSDRARAASAGRGYTFLYKNKSRLLGALTPLYEEFFMTENEIARQIVDAAYKIHVKFGPGLLESAYEALLAYELRKRGLGVTQQQPIPIIYEKVQLSVGYRADLIVEDKVIVELKSVEKVAPVHKKQLLTYLKLADKRLGLLINFGAALIKHGITRVVNGLRED